MEDKKKETRPNRKRRFLKVSGIIVLAACVLNTISGLFSSEPQVGHFRSAGEYREYREAYDEAMDELPDPDDTLDVPTSWGTVRVYVWLAVQDAGGPPVVLLPGRTAGVPMWYANISLFTHKHTVYAFDALGDAGMSVQSAPIETLEDMAGWISETLDALGTGPVHLVGHSFGGGNAASFALAHPEQVATLTLLEPAFALNFPSASTLLWAMVGSAPFLPKSWRDYGIAKMSGEDAQDVSSDDPVARMITLASSSYASSLPNPKTLTQQDWDSLGIPVYVALSDNSPITGPKALENAQKIPGAAVKVYENTTHSLPMQVPAELAADLDRFWS